MTRSEYSCSFTVGYSYCDQKRINSSAVSWLFDLWPEANKQLFVQLSVGYSYCDQKRINSCSEVQLSVGYSYCDQKRINSCSFSCQLVIRDQNRINSCSFRLNRQLFVQWDGYSIFRINSCSFSCQLVNCDQKRINSCSFSSQLLFDLRPESNKQLFVQLSVGYSLFVLWPEANKQLFIQQSVGYSICDQNRINSCSFSC